jgi:hypothetical protein
MLNPQPMESLPILYHFSLPAIFKATGMNLQNK